MATANKRLTILRLTALAVAGWAASAPLSARATDRIAVTARSVFVRAGGTDKGLSQTKLKEAEQKIDDALDRLTNDGIIGGTTPPPIVTKRDISKKETITSAEFLQYFRSLVYQRDLEVRRQQIDLLVNQAGAAKAAADAARAAADADRQQALADEAAARARAASQSADVVDPEMERRRQQIEIENARREQQVLIAMQKWIQDHAGQPLPADPKSAGGSTGSQTPAVTTGGGAASGGAASGNGRGSGGVGSIGAGGAINPSDLLRAVPQLLRDSGKPAPAPRSPADPKKKDSK